MAAAAKVFRQRIDDYLKKGQAYEAQQLMLTVINRLIVRNAINDARETIFSYTELLCQMKLWNAAAEVAALSVRILERVHAKDHDVSDDDFGLITSLFDCFSPLFEISLDSTDDAQEIEDSEEVLDPEDNNSATEQRHLPHVNFVNNAIAWARSQSAKAWSAFDTNNPELPPSDPHHESRYVVREDFARKLALIEAQLHGLVAQAYAYAAIKGTSNNREKFAKRAEESYIQALLPTDHSKFLSRLLAPRKALKGDVGDVIVEIRRRQHRFARATLLYIARGNLKAANSMLEMYRSLFPGDAPELSEIKSDDNNTSVIEFVVLLTKLCEYDAAPLFSQIRDLFESALCTPAASDADLSNIVDVIAKRYFSIEPPKDLFDSALSMLGL